MYLLDANECDLTEGSVRFTIKDGDFKLVELFSGEAWWPQYTWIYFRFHIVTNSG